MVEPGPAQVSQLTEKISVTMWDQWEIRGGDDMTLGQLFDRIKKKFGLTPAGVVQGTSMIYMPMAMYKKKLDLPLVSLLKETESRKYDMVVTFIDSKGANVEGAPPVRFSVRQSRSHKSSKGSRASSSKEKKEKKSKREKNSPPTDSEEPLKKKKKKSSVA